MLTVGQIKDIVRKEKISISKYRGQNFLIDQNIQKKIIAAFDLQPDDVVLEIGSGLGALTEDLAKQAGKVIAVEKDRALARIAQTMFCGYKNLHILHQDILKADLARLTKEKAKVVGNLPYYITTPIIAYLLEKQIQRIKDTWIAVQYEVGRRLVAKAGTKDYSALTIFVQYFTKPKLLFTIPKRAFYPQPKVDSVFMHLHILKEPSVKVDSQTRFFQLVHNAFGQRRKTILNSLTRKLDKTLIQEVLKEINIDFQARAEMLTLDDFARIEHAFTQRGLDL